MSILDLQSLPGEVHKGPPPGSRGSKGCGNVSGGNHNQSALSILCDLL
jgi:hypothetical protein